VHLEGGLAWYDSDLVGLTDTDDGDSGAHCPRTA
jgi:hypothetical protein